MYTLDVALSLGAGLAGVVSQLRAQFYDSLGQNVGTPISTGFVDMGNGNYHWHCSTIPDGHRGGVKFYLSGAPATTIGISAINPQDAEYLDQKVSTLTANIGEALAAQLIPEIVAAIGALDISVHPTRIVLGPCGRAGQIIAP